MSRVTIDCFTGWSVAKSACGVERFAFVGKTSCPGFAAESAAQIILELTERGCSSRRHSTTPKSVEFRSLIRQSWSLRVGHPRSASFGQYACTLPPPDSDGYSGAPISGSARFLKNSKPAVPEAGAPGACGSRLRPVCGIAVESRQGRTVSSDKKTNQPIGWLVARELARSHLIERQLAAEGQQTEEAHAQQTDSHRLVRNRRIRLSDCHTIRVIADQ